MGCALGTICVGRVWALLWTQVCRKSVGFALDTICVVECGLCSGHNLCCTAEGCVPDRVCVVRQWGLFWTHFTSNESGLCSGQSWCREGAGCALDTIPCCARVGCAAVGDSIFGHVVQPYSLSRDKTLRITQQANRLEESV